MELVEAIPEKSRSNVPPCLINTKFVIAVSDVSGRHAVQLIGREHSGRLIVNGVEALPASDEEPGFLALPYNTSLGSVLFPGTTENSWPTHKFTGHMAIHGLYYASAEFQQNYKSNEYEPMFVGGDVPFEVTSEGTLLAINCAHGYVANGAPTIKAIDWLRIFGSEEFVPASTLAIRKLAITDISSSVLKLPGAKTGWKFKEFLSELEGPMDKNVLLLGAYSSATEGRFSDAKVALERLGYTCFELRDSPDLPIQTNIEKLFAAVMFSSSIVVIDDHASGHIAELALLLQQEFRPTIILRSTPKPSTAFLEDSILTKSSFRIEVMENITAVALTPAIRWARKWGAKQKNQLNAINNWRS